jgi:hypothetical protein
LAGAAAGIALLAGPLNARAADRDGGRFELGLRVAYAMPTGKVDAGAPLSLRDRIQGQLPIWLDVGYRFAPHWYAGALASAGFVVPANCPSCNGSDVRFGVGARYYARPGETLDPWIGLGAGYELLSFTSAASANDPKFTVDASGFEIARVEAGLDARTSGALRAGPFVAASLGEYTSESVTAFNITRAATSVSLTLHAWLFVGVRGAFAL